MKFPSHKITAIRRDGHHVEVLVSFESSQQRNKKTITKNNNFSNSNSDDDGDGDDDDADENNVETFNLPLLRTQLFQSDKNASMAR